MAELDERLIGLVGALQRSNLDAMATVILERLDEAEADRAGPDGPDRDPFAPFPGETDEGRAARQLALIDVSVTKRVKVELDLLERSLALSRELSTALRSEGPEAFATIFVVDEADRAAAGKTPPGINLLTGARRERLQSFLDAWKRAVREVRTDIDGGLG